MHCSYWQANTIVLTCATFLNGIKAVKILKGNNRFKSACTVTKNTQNLNLESDEIQIFCSLITSYHCVRSFGGINIVHILVVLYNLLVDCYSSIKHNQFWMQLKKLNRNRDFIKYRWDEIVNCSSNVLI